MAEGAGRNLAAGLTVAEEHPTAAAAVAAAVVVREVGPMVGEVCVSVEAGRRIAGVRVVKWGCIGCVRRDCTESTIARIGACVEGIAGSSLFVVVELGCSRLRIGRTLADLACSSVVEEHIWV